MSIGVVETDGQVSGSYKVDVSRGQRIGRVSSEWFSRPADERYLSLADLYAAVHGRAARSATRTVESRAVRVEAGRDDAERLSLILPGQPELVAPTHWSFGQLAGLVGAPPISAPAPPVVPASTCVWPDQPSLEPVVLGDRAGRLALRAMIGPKRPICTRSCGATIAQQQQPARRWIGAPVGTIPSWK
jgi:hypothetical protein